MAINLTTTSEAARMRGVKVLVYGDAGVGKTRLCATAPTPVIISAEAGLLSLRDIELPVITVAGINDLSEAYSFLAESADAKQFETICLDSLSEIAETCLIAEKAVQTDPRKHYPEMVQRTTALVRAFRDLHKHVYFSAKAERQTDDTMRTSFQPSMPGQKLGPSLPYLFDEVFALRASLDAEGVLQRTLQTQPDSAYQAKDRSGALDMYEQPDLAAIIAKITGAK